MNHLIQRNIIKEPWIVGEILYSLYKARYFWLLVISLALSACFPKALPQFLVTALIAGIKWAIAGIPEHRNIVILEGGEKTCS